MQSLQSFFRVFRNSDSADRSTNNLAPPPNDVPVHTVDEVWERDTISLESADWFIGHATTELKLRGVVEPFILLPCRPNYDVAETKTLIHRIFADPARQSDVELQREIKLSDAATLASALKWVWARIPGGVVTWDVYELFKVGEEDSGMSEDVFKILIPLISESPERSRVIFNFFDILSSIASHWKVSGMSGGKIARLASWWAFPLSDDFAGTVDTDGQHNRHATFSEAYKIWLKAADASSHLFFAYLRAEASTTKMSVTSLSGISLTLSTLLASTPYPPKFSTPSVPETLVLSQYVTAYSSGPAEMLKRFGGLARRDKLSVSIDDLVVEDFLYSESDGEELHTYFTPEYSRIFNEMRNYLSLGEQRTLSTKPSNVPLAISESARNAIRTRNPSGSSKWSSASSSGPATPIIPSLWSEFTVSGFPSVTLEPKLSNVKTVIPARAVSNSASHKELRTRNTSALPQEVQDGSSFEIAKCPLDESLWWTWLCAYGPEETTSRKMVFSKCLIVEFDATAVPTGPSSRDRFVVLEERIRPLKKSASQTPPYAGRSSSRRQSSSQNLRRLASRRFNFRRPESSVLVATATINLRDRPSLLSLYREYQSGDFGNMTVNLVAPTSPGQERVKRLHDVVSASAKKSQEDEVRHDEDGSRSNVDRWSTARTVSVHSSVQQEVHQHELARRLQRISAVIEVDEVVSYALNWANTDPSDIHERASIAPPGVAAPPLALSRVEQSAPPPSSGPTLVKGVGQNLEEEQNKFLALELSSHDKTVKPRNYMLWRNSTLPTADGPKKNSTSTKVRRAISKILGKASRHKAQFEDQGNAEEVIIDTSDIYNAPSSSITPTSSTPEERHPTEELSRLDGMRMLEAVPLPSPAPNLAREEEDGIAKPVVVSTPDESLQVRSSEPSELQAKFGEDNVAEGGRAVTTTSSPGPNVNSLLAQQRDHHNNKENLFEPPSPYRNGVPSVSTSRPSIHVIGGRRAVPHSPASSATHFIRPSGLRPLSTVIQPITPVAGRHSTTPAVPAIPKRLRPPIYTPAVVQSQVNRQMIHQMASQELLAHNGLSPPIPASSNARWTTIRNDVRGRMGNFHAPHQRPDEYPQLLDESSYRTSSSGGSSSNSGGLSTANRSSKLLQQ